MEQFLIARELARMLWRRIFIFALVALVGVIGTVWYALSLERVYEATAVVQIRGPEISTDLTRETAHGATAQRIQQIEQKLRSRDSLFQVAEKYDLFPAPALTTSDRVNLMRKAVRLDSIAGVQNGYGVPSDPSALVIVARYADGEKAALMANEFVTRLLEDNLRDRERRSADALAFFRREEARLSQLIAELDQHVIQFKEENSGALPEGLAFRRDELSRLQEDQRDIMRQMMALERETSLLDDDGAQDPVPASDPVRLELSQLQIQLARMQSSAPNHPGIKQLELQIAALTDSEAERRRKVTERQRELITDETDLLTRQLSSISDRQNELVTFIRATPAVEMELAGYTRDREHLQQQLDAAIKGRSQAEIEQRMEANRQTERFEVLESALVPQYPVEPSRKKIAFAGTAGSIFLAAALVYLLELLNPVIRSSIQFRRLFGVAPTITLPHISTVWERRRRKLRKAVTLLLIIAGLPLSLYYLDRQVMSFEEMAELLDRLPLPTL